MKGMCNLRYNLSRFGRSLDGIKKSITGIFNTKVYSGVEIGILIRSSSVLAAINKVDFDVLVWEFGTTPVIGLVKRGTIEDCVESDVDFVATNYDYFDELMEACRDYVILVFDMSNTYDIYYNLISYKLRYSNDVNYFKGSISYVISKWNEMYESSAENGVDLFTEEHLVHVTDDDDMYNMLSIIVDVNASLLKRGIVLKEGVEWVTYEGIIGHEYDREEDFSLDILSDIFFYTNVISDDVKFEYGHNIYDLLSLMNGNAEVISYRDVNITSMIDLPAILYRMWKDSHLVNGGSNDDCSVTKFCELLPDYASLSGSVFTRPNCISVDNVCFYSDGSLSRSRSVKKFINCMKYLRLSPLFLHVNVYS